MYMEGSGYFARPGKIVHRRYFAGPGKIAPMDSWTILPKIFIKYFVLYFITYFYLQFGFIYVNIHLR